MLLPLLVLLQVGSPDTLRIHLVERPPQPGQIPDTTRYGPPQIRLCTGQGSALVWLLRAGDSVFVAAAIPDSTYYWGDDFVLSLNIRGEPGAKPGHDDFQWYFRRVLDSSVVYRGRDGRWEPPRDDPDWRLGGDRSGGGWEVSAVDDPRGWGLLLRLDPAWFRAEGGRLPRIAFRIYDDAPGGWFAWPGAPGDLPAKLVEQNPGWWSPIR